MTDKGVLRREAAERKALTQQIEKAVSEWYEGLPEEWKQSHVVVALPKGPTWGQHTGRSV